jgi:HemY protein
MIRALWLFILLTIMAVIAVWVVSLPGDITITVPGSEYHISVGGLGVVVVGLSIVLMLLWRFVSLFVAMPGEFTRWTQTRRRHKGFVALTRGLVAVAAGDAEDARRQTKKALALVGEPPLALLLAAQAAALDGDDEQAQRYYTQMLQSKEMEFLGLRGLYIAAARRGDNEQAISIAERALTLRPKTPWAINALFDLQSGKRAWESANAALDAASRAKLIDSSIAKRRRAVLATAAAKDADQRGDNAAALARSQEALSLAPGFAPAALIAAKHLSAQGRQWKAASLIETAWAQEPHPDLARAYAALKPEETAPSRAKRLSALAGMNPDHPESRFLSAAVAISAGRLEDARDALKPLADRFPVARVCLLMADIERGFGGDSLVAREWANRALRAPRDAQWVCSACARTTNEWSATCPHCHGFDTLSWQSGAGAQVETMMPADEATVQEPVDTTLYRDAVKAADAPSRAIVPRSAQPPVMPPGSSAAPERPMTPSAPREDEPVIFAPRAPDDPGPDYDEFALDGDDRRQRRMGSW